MNRSRFAARSFLLKHKGGGLAYAVLLALVFAGLLFSTLTLAQNAQLDSASAARSDLTPGTLQTAQTRASAARSDLTPGTLQTAQMTSASQASPAPTAQIRASAARPALDASSDPDSAEQIAAAANVATVPDIDAPGLAPNRAPAASPAPAAKAAPQKPASLKLGAAQIYTSGICSGQVESASCVKFSGDGGVATWFDIIGTNQAGQAPTGLCDGRMNPYELGTNTAMYGTGYNDDYNSAVKKVDGIDVAGSPECPPDSAMVLLSNANDDAQKFGTSPFKDGGPGTTGHNDYDISRLRQKILDSFETIKNRTGLGGKTFLQALIPRNLNSATTEAQGGMDITCRAGQTFIHCPNTIAAPYIPLLANQPMFPLSTAEVCMLETAACDPSYSSAAVPVLQFSSGQAGDQEGNWWLRSMGAFSYVDPSSNFGISTAFVAANTAINTDGVDLSEAAPAYAVRPAAFLSLTDLPADPPPYTFGLCKKRLDGPTCFEAADGAGNSTFFDIIGTNQAGQAPTGLCDGRIDNRYGANAVNSLNGPGYLDSAGASEPECPADSLMLLLSDINDLSQKPYKIKFNSNSNKTTGNIYNNTLVKTTLATYFSTISSRENPTLAKSLADITVPRNLATSSSYAGAASNNCYHSLASSKIDNCANTVRATDGSKSVASQKLFPLSTAEACNIELNTCRQGYGSYYAGMPYYSVRADGQYGINGWWLRSAGATDIDWNDDSGVTCEGKYYAQAAFVDAGDEKLENGGIYSVAPEGCDVDWSTGVRPALFVKLTEEEPEPPSTGADADCGFEVRLDANDNRVADNPDTPVGMECVGDKTLKLTAAFPGGHYRIRDLQTISGARTVASDHSIALETPTAAPVRLNQVGNVSTLPVESASGIDLKAGAKLNLNTISGALWQSSSVVSPAVHVPEGADLEISGSGRVSAESLAGSRNSAGIGSLGINAESSGEVSITGSASVSATAANCGNSYCGAGIGSGGNGNTALEQRVGKITISTSGTVEATGGSLSTASSGSSGAGIGSGGQGSAGTSTLPGKVILQGVEILSGVVKATGGAVTQVGAGSGAGIGTGGMCFTAGCASGSSFGSISISGGTVVAKGGAVRDNVYGAGAGIGFGGWSAAAKSLTENPGVVEISGGSVVAIGGLSASSTVGFSGEGVGAGGFTGDPIVNSEKIAIRVWGGSLWTYGRVGSSKQASPSVVTQPLSLGDLPEHPVYAPASSLGIVSRIIVPGAPVNSLLAQEYSAPLKDLVSADLAGTPASGLAAVLWLPGESPARPYHWIQLASAPETHYMADVLAENPAYTAAMPANIIREEVCEGGACWLRLQLSSNSVQFEALADSAVHSSSLDAEVTSNDPHGYRIYIKFAAPDLTCSAPNADFTPQDSQSEPLSPRGAFGRTLLGGDVLEQINSWSWGFSAAQAEPVAWVAPAASHLLAHASPEAAALVPEVTRLHFGARVDRLQASCPAYQTSAMITAVPWVE